MKKKIISFAILFALLVAYLVPPTSPTVKAAISDVKMVAAGSYHTAIIKTDNSLWMYGDNSSGQLGDGTQTASADPIKIMTGVKDVAVGRKTTVALKTDGSVWVWGNNVYEQLGIKAKPTANGGVVKANDSCIVTEPVQLMTGVKDVDAGEDFMMALKTDGSLYVWGCNCYCQLGIDEESENARSKMVPNVPKGRVPNFYPTKILSDVASISAGGHHAAAVKTDGSLYVWGDNTQLQCGIVTTGGYVAKPTKIMDSGVKTVSCGGLTTAIIKTNGDLYMCGDNLSGQLGTGDIDILGIPRTRSFAPVKVLSGVKAVSALRGTTMALKSDGSLYIWGYYNGDTILTPKKITDGIASLATGSRIMAVKTNGTLWGK